MDLAVIESNNGGDLVKNPKDLYVIFGFENFMYLAMFGGNLAQSTPSTRDLTQQAFDFWGNNLIWPNDSSQQANSETERALNTYPLTSAGRILIENAIKKDLEILNPFVNVTVTTSITATDRIEWLITLIKPSNLKSTQFTFIWDATIQELSIVKGTSGNPIPFVGGVWDLTFDFTFGA